MTTPPRPITVLLAEDEESFVDALVVGLGREGFEVTVARDGNEALRLFDESEPDVVLLDLMLPKLSGMDVCRTIRSRSNVPIIMVTAKSAEIDTVVGLELGADDYVAKPYRLRELVARIRAVLRRGTTGGAAEPGDDHHDDHRGTIRGASHGTSQAASRGASRGAEPEEGSREAGEVRVDLDTRRVFVRGDEVRLRRKEFELLALLVENAGRVLTRDVLIDRIWGADYIGDTKTLDVHVKRLRSRIESDPSHPELITTVRGVGYRFEAPAARH